MKSGRAKGITLGSSVVQRLRNSACGRPATQRWLLHGSLLSIAFLGLLAGIANRRLPPSSGQLTTVSVAPGGHAGYFGPEVDFSSAKIATTDATDPVAVAAVSTAPTSTPPLVTPSPGPAPAPQVPYFTYTVQAGDTVDSIAAGFGISPDYVIWNNSDITDPDSLLVGATLLIPSTDGLVYNVALGDTLTNIADTYGVDIESIVDFGPNQLATPDSVIEGEALVLPGALPPQPLQAIAEPVPAAAEDIPAENISPSSTGFIWPWTGAISQPFGPTDFESFHKGIDIDGYGYVGAPIVAAASGTVVLTAWDDYGLGYHVIIDHGNGVQTIYGHLSDIWVAQGQYVSQGDAIGALGSTGYSTGPHLHFQVDVDGAPVDPMLYLP